MVDAACYCAIRGIARARDPELRGLHAADPRSTRPAGTIVNPVLPAACGARGVDRLPRLRRGHGRARAGRAGPGDRGRRGRADADRDRRLRRGRQAVRARPRCSSAAGARARAATGSRACRTRSPTCRTSRSSWSRADLPLRVERYGLVARLGRRRALPRRARLRARVRAARRRGGADDPLRPARPPALRPRRRRAGRAVGERRRLGGEARALPTMPMEALQLAQRRRLHTTSRPAAAAAAPVRARPGARARGRARREGDASTRRASATASSIADGTSTRGDPRPEGSR